MCPFDGAQFRASFDAAGGLARIGAQEHGQPGDGAFIVFTPAAYVADPGGEVRHGDQFSAEPGEVGDVTEVHDPGGAFAAWGMFGFGQARGR